MAKPKLSGAQLLKAGKYAQQFKDTFPGTGIDGDGLLSTAADKARAGMLDEDGNDWTSRLQSAIETEYFDNQVGNTPEVNGPYTGIPKGKS